MAKDSSHLLYDRSWMYQRQFDDGAFNIAFLRGVEEFLKFAISKSRVVEIRCPCSKCKNFEFKNPSEVRDHLLQNGFVENYYDWRYHCYIIGGEGSSSNAFVQEEVHMSPPTRNNEKNQLVRNVHDAAGSRFPNKFHTFFPQNNSPYDEEHSPLDRPQAHPQILYHQNWHHQQKPQQQYFVEEVDDEEDMDDDEGHTNNEEGRPQMPPQVHQHQPQPQSQQQFASSDNPEDHRPLLPWLPIQKQFDASKEPNSRRGISANIGKAFKLSLDPSGTSWTKVPEKIKKLYWEEFKKCYKWDPQIDRDVYNAWYSRCSQRYRDIMNKLRKREKEKLKEQGHNEQFLNALKSYSNTQEFKDKSNRGKSNRRKGNADAPPLPTYRGGPIPAARLREMMAKEADNVEPTPYNLLLRTKGVCNEDGQRVLITEHDKKIDEHYRKLEAEALRKGETPDYSQIYKEAIREVTRNKKKPPLSSHYYGLGSANEFFYPDLNDHHYTPREERNTPDDMRVQLEELKRIHNELKIFMQAQLDENNPTKESFSMMEQRLRALEESAQELQRALGGESSNAGIGHSAGRSGGRQGMGGDMGTSTLGESCGSPSSR